MHEDGRDKIVRFLAGLIADILQKGVVEKKRPKIVWEDQPIEAEYEESSHRTERDPQ